MNTKDYLRYIAEEIHTTIIATVDDEGLPVTCAIDIMDYDDNHLYFLTAKGKAFYHRLLQRGYIALTGLKGKDTMHCVSVSVQGKVEDIGEAMLPRLFEKNPYMNDIYPTRASRQALTVFRVYEGNGEWFDLSKKPIERASFTFGAAQKAAEGSNPAQAAEAVRRYVPSIALISAQRPPSFCQITACIAATA